MTPQQAKIAVQLLRGQVEAATKLATDGGYNDEPYSADTIAAFVANAAAYRAAIAVLEAHAQPVIALPPTDPDGLDVLAAFDRPRQWVDLHDFSRVRSGART